MLRLYYSFLEILYSVQCISFLTAVYLKSCSEEGAGNKGLHVGGNLFGRKFGGLPLFPLQSQSWTENMNSKIVDLI